VITDRLAEAVRAAVEKTASEGGLALEEAPPVVLERPKRREHGDWATNVAMVLAKDRGEPREIAAAIAERIDEPELIARVEVAGPGFLNIHLSPLWLHDVVRRACDPEARYGDGEAGAGIQVNVEYVSSNPTGPINVVSGRHAAYGDALANLLEATGHGVTREFYWNDMGRQIRLFGDSIAARYLQNFGIDAPLPEDGYRGDYVVEIAAGIAEEVGDAYLEVPDEERSAFMSSKGMEKMLEAARESLERFGTRFDVWRKESSLHSAGEVFAAVERLRDKGYAYEQDGAVFFASTRFGDDKDRVLIRAGGQPTYFAADVAYLVDKFGRGFDRLIYVWGADHHGTVPRLLAGVEALGFERDRVEVPILQMVTLARGGEAVKASKRAGVLALLDELVDEVGVDAARYTFLTRSVDAPLEFDIELAKEQAPENPVYYVQYAHARICSILKKAGESGLEVSPSSAALELLTHPSEDELMRKLASFEEVVTGAAEGRAPQKITRYVEELASTFSAFYRDCKVISEDLDLSGARLALCIATKSVIARGLELLGVKAPERM
jgi:arginyl-tRNA synthetase